MSKLIKPGVLGTTIVPVPTAIPVYMEHTAQTIVDMRSPRSYYQQQMKKAYINF